jgi:isopenicillin N synthase-like dioxygenase|uniref:Fe2OG dioxygenase domain-containing protein n=1 Tax=Globisporangium ultimum (strain ATCC 200006 / CBS 805.95 / DAOM BR144) TaxID=431595 RepID=K3WAM4_GLOUD
MTELAPPAAALRVPVVDIGALMACRDDAEVQAILARADGPFRTTISALQSALTEWGFFYIANHGVTPELMERFQSAIKRFFALPKELKNTIRRDKANPLGFFDDEFTKNKKDWKEVFDFSGRYEELPENREANRSAKYQNRWLAESVVPGFKDTLIEYYDHMEHIARRLLMLVAVSLGEHVTFFDQFFHSKTGFGENGDKRTRHPDNNSSAMRLNYYPIARDPEETMGVHHHTDPGALTVLYQDDSVSSLQVFHRSSQQWQNLPPIADTFVVNIGDMIQVWSNDKYCASLHRALANGTSERFSSPFFYNPAFDANIHPVLVDADDQPKYKELNWHEYIMSKVLGNYVDLGEEDLHISHYRVEGAAADNIAQPKQHAINA